MCTAFDVFCVAITWPFHSLVLLSCLHVPINHQSIDGWMIFFVWPCFFSPAFSRKFEPQRAIIKTSIVPPSLVAEDEILSHTRKRARLLARVSQHVRTSFLHRTNSTKQIARTTVNAQNFCSTVAVSVFLDGNKKSMVSNTPAANGGE
jgi:hypothetical protein